MVPTGSGGNTIGLAEKLTMGAVPVPLMGITWSGKPVIFTVRFAVRVPAAVGVNTMLISHFCAAATGPVQVLV